jgi:hypothetical protein
MKTTETATCRHCHQTITRVAPARFAALAKGEKPTEWTGEDGEARCSVGGGASVAHEPELAVKR